MAGKVCAIRRDFKICKFSIYKYVNFRYTYTCKEDMIQMFHVKHRKVDKMIVEIKGMGKINATKEMLNEIAITFSKSCEYNAQKVITI